MYVYIYIYIYIQNGNNNEKTHKFLSIESSKDLLQPLDTATVCLY